MKKNSKQIYEDYWSLTLEYTDYKSLQFNCTLNLIIEYIDKYEGNIDSKIYKMMQEELMVLTPKSSMASIRKAINQFLKLGFINNRMKGYHPRAKEFLLETDVERKKIIYSQVLYDNSSFNRSFSNPTSENQINFLIKTIECCNNITKDELLIIMYQHINDYPKGYIDRIELENIKIESNIIDKKSRKYNQQSYLFNLCKNVLTGVYTDADNNLTLYRDEQINELTITKGRDSYKQILYKHELYRESIILFKQIECFYENLSYPSLIASHIKPYIVCEEDEKFDSENGLLLSRNIDQLFDSGWISFSSDGSVLCAKKLDPIIKEKLINKKLDRRIIKSEARRKYLEYHRNNIFNKDKDYKFPNLTVD